MLGVFLGFLLGGVCAGLIYLIGGCIADNCYYKYENCVKTIFSVLAIIILLVGGFVGCYVEYTNSCCYVEKYEVIKTTIENSLSIESLTGFERIGLVNSATEYNATLSELKFKCNQWYGFTVTKDVLNLEYIDLGVGGSNG